MNYHLLLQICYYIYRRFRQKMLQLHYYRYYCNCSVLPLIAYLHHLHHLHYLHILLLDQEH